MATLEDRLLIYHVFARASMAKNRSAGENGDNTCDPSAKTILKYKYYQEKQGTGYNTIRPHSSLGQKPSASEAVMPNNYGWRTNSEGGTWNQSLHRS